jgi:hypothetical protein
MAHLNQGLRHRRALRQQRIHQGRVPKTVHRIDGDALAQQPLCCSQRAFSSSQVQRRAAVIIKDVLHT